MPLSTGKVTTLKIKLKTTPVQRAGVSLDRRPFFGLPGTIEAARSHPNCLLFILNPIQSV